MAEKSIGNFKLIKEEHIDEINADAAIYQHDKLGSYFFHLKTDDNNKAFATAFRTHPEDSTGVGHILEHSVLSGSEKYPVKEPFVNLMKNSLNTFLNAMTSADSTMYPVASCNEKDLLNLASVYLDGLFAPMIYHDKQIFRQEGRHFELEDDKPVINGVVYNEMKGAMASDMSQALYYLSPLVYDNTYKNWSGGIPEEICNLSYEAFLDYHRKFYHPTNAYFYLYGNMDAEKIINLIEDEYLSKFEKSEKVGPPPLAAEIEAPRYLSKKFPSNDEKNTAATILLHGANEDYVDSRILEAVYITLFSLDSSKLRERLIKKELISNLSAYFDISRRDRMGFMLYQGVVENDAKNFEKAVFDDLFDFLDECANDEKLYAELRESLIAAINRAEFNMREADTDRLPKGLLYGWQVSAALLNGGDPFKALRFEDDMQKAREFFAEGDVIGYIKENIIENNNRATVIMQPDPEMSARMKAEEDERVARLWNALSDEEKAEELKLNEELKIKQTSPDKKEDLDKLPVLELKDIDKEHNLKELKEKSLDDGIKVLHYEDFTSGIYYFDLFFDISPLRKFADEEAELYMGYDKKTLFNYALLPYLLGSLPSENYEYAALKNAMLANTGGIYFDTYQKETGDFLRATLKVQEDKSAKGIELLKEIIFNTHFDEKELLKARLTEILVRIESTAAESASQLACIRAESYIKRSRKITDITSGIDFYYSLKELMQDFDKRYQDLVKGLKNICKTVFGKRNLIIGLTADKNDFDKAVDVLSVLISSLPEGNEPVAFDENNSREFKLAKLNEAYTVPSGVQGTAMSTLIDYKPEMAVLMNILGLDYLWNKIRAQGGAYGAFTRLDRKGLFTCQSYRDPNCSKTIEAYKQIPDFIRSIELDRRELDNAIIGTFGKIDRPGHVYSEAKAAFSRYFNEIGLDELQAERDRLLSLELQDLLDLADEFEKLAETDAYCVVGSEDTIKKDAGLFKEIRKLI